MVVRTATVRLVLGRALAVACVAALAGCGLVGGGKKGQDPVSVFSVEVGQCFAAPPKVQAELSSLTKVDCALAHAQEAYASVPFEQKQGQTSSGYPGPELLTNFAQGACAQQFAKYVGTDYRDSALFFTYLLPSARSWEQGKDRKVTCFITAAGQPLTGSVKGTKK